MLREILSSLLSSDIPGFTFSILIPLLFLSAMIKNRRSRQIILYFCWGLFAVVFAYILNEWFSSDLDLSVGLTSDIAPIIEESLKALPLLLFFRRRDDDDPNLIIYCAMASGIGFSVQETLYYFTSFTAASGLSALFPLLVRTVTTCLMHGMSTAVIGFGFVITSRFKGIRIPMLLGLLSLAATIHSLYNILIGTRLAIVALLCLQFCFLPAWRCLPMMVMKRKGGLTMSLNAKDRQWLSELFDAYYDKVYAFLYARTGNIALAEDLASQTFVKIAEHYKSYQGEKGALSTWIFTIALNEMRSYFRRQKGRETATLDGLSEIPGSADTEADIVRGEEHRELLSLLSLLDERDYSVVTLKYYGGLSNGEIGKILDLSETNVGTVLNRALKKIRCHWAKSCDDDGVFAYKSQEESI